MQLVGKNMRKIPRTESNGAKKNKPSLRTQIGVYLSSFVFLFAQISPTYSAVLQSQTIEYDVQASPYFIKADSSAYQYQGQDYIEESPTNTAIAAQGITSITAFYSAMQQAYPNSVTTNHKYLGSSYVQNRYVRKQLHDLLGRHLLSPYTSEGEQLHNLYSNALSYVAASGGVYGQNLNRHQLASGYSGPLVWPELRMINGENVLVPVLYLDEQTAKAQKIVSTTNSVGALSGFGTVSVDGVTVQLGREGYLALSKDLLVTNGGAITAAGSLDIVTGGVVRNLSGLISAQDDLSIITNGIENTTIVYRYDSGNEQGTRYGRVSELVSGSGSLSIKSYGDIKFIGGIASAEDEVTLDADGSIDLGSAGLYSSSQGRYGTGEFQEASVTFLQSGITAGDTITLMANGYITIDAAEIVSKNGHIEILSGLGITVKDELGAYQYQASGKFGRRDVTESIYQTVAVRTLLDAGKGVRLHTEHGDITLRATDITSTEGTQLTASNGSVNLLLTTETDHYNYTSAKKNIFTASTRQKGHYNETGVPNTIVGGLTVEALKGVNIQYEGDPELGLDEQISQLAQLEGLEWMAQVRENTPDADWEAIEAEYDSWDESHTSLTPAFTAVVSIAAAMAAGPAGASFASSVLFNAAATGVIGATTTTVLYASINAGTAALLTQATTVAINGAVNDDISGAMEEFASNETFTSLATSMVTAGAIAALDVALFNLDTKGMQDVANAADTESALVAAKNAAEQALNNQAVQTVVRHTISAGTQTILEGGDLGDFGDNFADTLANHLVNTLTADLASEIGIAHEAGDLNKLSQYFAHIALGCAAGAAKGEIAGGTEASNDCSSGAGGALIGELTGDIYKELSDVDLNNLDNWKGTGVNFAELISAFSVALAGGNVEVAAFTGRNAAENNSLSFVEGYRHFIAAAGCASAENVASCLYHQGWAAYSESADNDANILIGLKEGFKTQYQDLQNFPDDAWALLNILLYGDSKEILNILAQSAEVFGEDVVNLVDAGIKVTVTGDSAADYQKVGNEMSKVITVLVGAGTTKVALEAVRVAGHSVSNLGRVFEYDHDSGEFVLDSGDVAQVINRDSDWFEDVALSGTWNPESNKLVLGRYSLEGPSYQKVAAYYEATYFELNDWSSVTKGLTETEIWRINETFLDQQILQGKQILFSHNPLDVEPNTFFENEVDYLRAAGYGFRQKDQWTWEAIR